MALDEKIIQLSELPAWRAALRRSGKKLVATNGCFDLLHAGHVRYLEGAKSFGDALLVGLNGDESVRQLKGPSRPVNMAGDRAVVLAALASVDAVTVFPEMRATHFLELCQPDVYVKGGDYTVESLNAEERSALERCGAIIELIPFVAGKSTSGVLKRLATPQSSA